MREDPGQRDTETASALRGAVTRLARRLRSERPRDALSPTKIAVLADLHGHGPSTPSDVADREHQQLQSLTRVFAELESTGLITRRPSSDDRRASILAVSATGAETLQRDMAQRDLWLAEALEGLDETEIVLLRVAAKLIDQLAAAPRFGAAGGEPA